jgi:alpha-1,6-mannosyltransferase
MRRLALLGLLSLLLYLVGRVWQPPLEWSYQPLYFLWFSALSCTYTVALVEVRRRSSASSSLLLPLILGFALMFRLSLLWVTPGFLSDDFYRYVWDGLVQQAGINPYYYPPEASQLAFLRDDTIFPMINRKWALTIYPPGAQLFFRTMAWLCPGKLVAMKGVILLADAGSIALLLRLLKQLERSQSLVLLYAWHPLVAVELGISGHLDGLMIPFVLLAFLWRFTKHPWLAGLALGAATLIKLYPAILLPVLYRRRGWEMPIAFLAIVGAGYLLYLDAGRQIIGYLPYYMAPNDAYNSSLRVILKWMLGMVAPNASRYAQWLAGAILLFVMAQCARRQQKSLEEAIQWGVRLIALYLLLVSPSVYEWYLLWLLALVTLTQTWSLPGWLYWSWSANLDYLELYWRWSVNRHYLETLALNWLRVAEYGPLFLWLAGRWLWRQANKLAPGMNKGEPAEG